MDKNTIDEIRELNKEIKDIVKNNSEDNKTIIPESDFVFDQSKNNFNQDLIDKALIDGLHLEDKHLYPSDPNKKHKGKNYYCVYKYKEGFILVNYLLISYAKRKEKIILFHISPLSFGSIEQRKYK